MNCVVLLMSTLRYLNVTQEIGMVQLDHIVIDVYVMRFSTCVAA